MPKAMDRREASVSVKKKWVRLTRTCNNCCLFCLDKEAQNGSIISLSEIKRQFQQGREEKCEQVILSGGEPTLHPKFISIVKMARDFGYNKIQVITNGRMFAYKNFLDSAVNAGVSEITFSIHGHNAELHDFLTGIKGSFSQALAGLLNALKIPGLIISQDIVINRYNYRYLAEIMEFFINLGVAEFDLLHLIPFGRAWNNRRQVFYNIKQAMPYLRKAFELSKNPNLFIWTNRFPAKYLDGFEELIQHPKKIVDEVKGRERSFRKFLKAGEHPSCYPERCKFCFLNNFCRDFSDFKKRGLLLSEENPPCQKARLGAGTKAKLTWTENISIDKFTDFYICHRYFVKGPKCNSCKFNKKCHGTDVNYIRQHGFKTLSPIKQTKYV